MSDCINIITAGKSGRSGIEIPRDMYVDYFYEDIDVGISQLDDYNKQEYLKLFTSKYADIVNVNNTITSNSDFHSPMYNEEGMKECEKVIKNRDNALYVITICVAITDGTVRFPTLIEFLCVPKESCKVGLDSRQEEELTKFLKNEVRTSIYNFYKSVSKSSTVNEINSEKEILSIFAKHIEHIPYVDILCRCDDNADLFDQHKEIKFFESVVSTTEDECKNR